MPTLTAESRIEVALLNPWPISGPGPSAHQLQAATTAVEELVTECNRNMKAACDRAWDDTPASKDAAMGLLNEFMNAVTAMERLGSSPEVIKAALAPSTEVFATAALAKRCQEWERGYAGDFQTIEHLMGAENHSAPGTLGWNFEQIILEFPATRQHRNKLNRQADECVKAVRNRPDARILSMACGGGWDWLRILPFLAGFSGEIFLHDCEPAALESIEARLRPATPHYRLAPGNVLRTASRLSREPGFDLVAAGGLFDYVSDKAAVSLLRAMRGLLAPGGKLFFTNIAEGNVWRPFLEYGLNWRIIERSAEQIETLCLEAGFRSSDLTITREATGLTLLVDAVRPE